MVRRAAAVGDAKVYDISGTGGASLLPTATLGQRQTALQRRARRKAEAAQQDTQLLDDFSFPTLCTRIKASGDGHIFAAGAYAPQLHVYDTRQLSMKFKRHVNAEIVDFQLLGDDWRKFALLHADRYVDIHSQYGSHCRLRVPRPARDLVIHRGTAELYVAGAGHEVWRLNLEQGRFMPPLATRRPGISCAGLSPVNRLLALGGEDGVIEMWDPRTPKAAVGGVDLAGKLRSGGAIRSLRFDEHSGVTLAAGTDGGHVALFDLRASKPRMLREQGYGCGVHTLRFMGDDRLLSACRKSIKVCKATTGKNFLSLEPDASINHVCVMDKSGVLAVAVDAPRVRAYYVPSLGPAPRWCAFLDTYTEELEDGESGGIVDEAKQGPRGHKFVTRAQLEELGLDSLLGTPACTPVAHGFYVPAGAYRRAAVDSEPFAYERYVLERAQAAVERQRESRIGKVRTTKRPRVNADVAERLAAAAGGKGRKALAAGIVKDERFSALFTDEAFRVDPSAERYKLLHPSGTAAIGEAKGGGDDDENEGDSSADDELEAQMASEDDNDNISGSEK